MSFIEESLTEQIVKRKNNNSLRYLDCKSFGIDFCSNDYLGLAKSEIIQKNILASYLNKKSIGSTGSRLITGNSNNYQCLEKFLSKFHKAENALIFNSGYDANVGFFSTIPQRGDIILYDELSHASIRDGIRLSFAKGYSFKHNDLADLKSKLQFYNGNLFVSVESVYSMDGDFSPIDKIVSLCDQFGAYLIVDEAHSTGVFGKNGEGLVVSKGLENKVFARLHTFGKAMGAHGAAWLCSKVLKDYLVNYCRPFIYTTALPSHSIEHIYHSYFFLKQNFQLITELQNKIKYFKKLIEKYNIPGFIDSKSPIQSCVISGNKNVKRVANKMQNRGFDIRPILHPTVPQGFERIRICIHVNNSSKEILSMVKNLKVAIT